MKNNSLTLILFILGLTVATCTKRDTPSTGTPSLAASTQSIQGKWTVSGAEVVVKAKNVTSPIRKTTINLPAKQWEFGTDGNLHIQAGTVSLSAPYSQKGSQITLIHNGVTEEMELGADDNAITLTSIHNMPDGTIATEVIHLVK